MLRLLSTSFQFCSAVLLVAVAPGVRASDDVLEGWDKYKFGMTIEQVQAVPGIAWGETEAQEFGNETSKHLKAAAPVKIGTSTYNLNTVFKPDMLIRIDFENTAPVKSITETGADGTTTVTWTLGEQVGVQKLTAAVGPVNGSPVTFTALVLF